MNTTTEPARHTPTLPEKLVINPRRPSAIQEYRWEPDRRKTVATVEPALAVELVRRYNSHAALVAALGECADEIRRLRELYLPKPIGKPDSVILDAAAPPSTSPARHENAQLDWRLHPAL